MPNTTNNRYIPQNPKNKTALNRVIFTDKKEKLPKDDNLLHREKFKKEIKNQMAKKR